MNKLTQTLFVSLAALALAAFTLGPMPAQAQNEADEIYFGVQGGLAQTSYSGTGTDASSRQGFSGGVHVMYNINEALSAQLDVEYTERGATSITASGGNNVSDAFDLSGDEFQVEYLSFPLLLKLTAPIEQVKVRAMAGPSISFLVDATQNGSDIQRNIQSQLPVTNRFLLYDVAGVVGGELAFPLPGLANSEIAVDGRYSFGLVNVDQTQGFELNNRSFSGSLLFRFQLD